MYVSFLVLLEGGEYVSNQLQCLAVSSPKSLISATEALDITKKIGYHFNNSIQELSPLDLQLERKHTKFANYYPTTPKFYLYYHRGSTETLDY